ncbi:MAG: efflux RND transporter permease subunit [Gammaproteobacteria bacterium]|nr:efflux RND transporter permease subunit [Gammaproteobacteria bacterium]
MNGRRDLLGTFAHHRVAANLLMVMMLLAGLFALRQLNVQFFPDFELEVITVTTPFRGASAEDVEVGVTLPLEQRLRTVDHLEEMTSTSAPGASAITLEFDEGTDMGLALEQVKQRVDDFVNLPEEAEEPVVTHPTRYEPVARLRLGGLDDPRELRQLARRFERELLARGIDRVDIDGLPEEAIRIAFEPDDLQRLGLGLEEIAARIDRLSRDLPAGLAGSDDSARELRSLDQRRVPSGFAELPLVGEGATRIDLGTVAEIRRAPLDRQPEITVDGRPAVILQLSRTADGDSFAAARRLDAWLADTRPTLPPGIELEVFSERWELIRDRVNVLLKNGAGGLLLVLVILYLFLSGRVAFWVAVGIPVSFMATLAVLHLAGGSINMVTLFALIMGLGIIVDDAIVVGEDAQAHYDMGEEPLSAAEGGARRMLGPVLASSLTTVAAFLPLMLVGGVMGNILSAIPLVIVSVILASLIESFLILPGHLRGAFRHARHRRRPLRERLDAAFARFRDRRFRPLVDRALRHRATTLAAAFAALILAVGLIAGGRLGWVFFPSPESTTVHANVRFVAGTPRAAVDRFLGHLEATLETTDAALGPGVVATHYVAHGAASGRGGGRDGERIGSLFVELIAPDAREVRNREFIRAWRTRIEVPHGVESFTLTEQRAGPVSRDLEVRLAGDDPERVKQAALALGEALASLPGVTAIDDDLPYGREQLIYTLSPSGRALGLTVAELGRQLRAAYDGLLVQRFQDGPDEVEVRVELDRDTRRRMRHLETLPIRLPDGRFVPLASVAEWSSRRGFETLRHADGRLAATVTADVDSTVNNTERVTRALAGTTLPRLAALHGVEFSLEGGSARQAEALGDLRAGMLLGLLLIYIVLAWVFGSYGWPLIVMSAIPFGLTGALFGHWLLGMDLTLLSLFGFFGLSGIVVNDSIILVTFYQRLRAEGLAVREALVEAACQRLRAVLLTSLTTIAGLTPLLFETSTQAQFLIPMAVSIAFGLALATLLILLVVPTMLSLYEELRARRTADPAETATSMAN